MTRTELRELLDGDLAQHFRFHPGRRVGGVWSTVALRAANPYFLPVLLVRISGFLASRHHRVLARLVSQVTLTLFGLEVAGSTAIGPGLYLPHTQGTVIGAASIGKNAIIYHNVTLGARLIDVGFDPTTRPVLGDDVLIGSGAKVLGPVIIGDGCVVGANAVIVRSIAAGMSVTADGVERVATRRRSSKDPLDSTQIVSETPSKDQ